MSASPTAPCLDRFRKGGIVWGGLPASFEACRQTRPEDRAVSSLGHRCAGLLRRQASVRIQIDHAAVWLPVRPPSAHLSPDRSRRWRSEATVHQTSWSGLQTLPAAGGERDSCHHRCKSPRAVSPWRRSSFSRTPFRPSIRIRGPRGTRVSSLAKPAFMASLPGPQS